MQIIHFLLALTLPMLFAICLMCAYYLHRQRREMVFVYVGALFVLYIFDNTVLFMTEFIPTFASAYATLFISHPVFKTVYYAFAFFLYISIMRTLLSEQRQTIDYGVVVLFTIFLLSAPLIPSVTWRVWLFYLPMQVMTFIYACNSLRRLKPLKTSYEPDHYRLAHTVFLIAAISSVLILVEDTIVIFNFDVYTTGVVNINERSFTESVMEIILSIMFIRYAIRAFDAPDKNPFKVYYAAVFGERPENIDSTVLFCRKAQLTNRETEVMKLVAHGEDLSHIADQLFISTGTVKAHLHAIYQKTGVNNRADLLIRYQEFVHTLENT